MIVVVVFFVIVVVVVVEVIAVKQVVLCAFQNNQRNISRPHCLLTPNTENCLVGDVGAG